MPLASISQLKVRCNQEEKLRTELARWSTAEHDLKEKEKSVWLLKVSYAVCSFLADQVSVNL